MTLGMGRELRPREDEAVDRTVHSKAGRGSKLGAVVGGVLSPDLAPATFTFLLPGGPGSGLPGAATDQLQAVCGT